MANIRTIIICTNHNCYQLFEYRENNNQINKIRYNSHANEAFIRKSDDVKTESHSMLIILITQIALFCEIRSGESIYNEIFDRLKGFWK